MGGWCNTTRQSFPGLVFARCPRQSNHQSCRDVQQSNKRDERHKSTNEVSLACVPIEEWRLICISDAGHAKRANGDSQGGFLLGLTSSLVREQKLAPMRLVDWARKKLKRVVRSSIAAETHAGNDALDAIEFFQSLMAETLYGVTPREF